MRRTLSNQAEAVGTPLGSDRIGVDHAIEALTVRPSPVKVAWKVSTHLEIATMFRSPACALGTLLLLLLAPVSAPAFHQVTPPLLQVTPPSMGAGTIENQRFAGIRYVVFDSTADPLGIGNMGRQVFLFDLRERAFNHTLGVVQLTSGSSDARRPTTGKLGTQVVWDAIPSGGGARQLFLFDRRYGIGFPLTRGGADSVNAVMDETSRTVVFESDADLLSAGIGGRQLFRIDLRKIDPSCPFPCPASRNEGLVQLTNRAGTSRNAAPSSGGKIVAFESDADLTGVGEHTSQVYTYHVKKGVYTLLGHGPGASRRPSISNTGGWVAFDSDTDLLASGTTGTQLYAYKKNKKLLQQITDRSGGSSTGPSVSSNGHALSFVSTDDLVNHGSTGPEVFSYDLRHRALRQITASSASARLAVYAGGVFVTFLADGDLLGNGSSNGGLYLANVFAMDTATVP